MEPNLLSWCFPLAVSPPSSDTHAHMCTPTHPHVNCRQMTCRLDPPALATYSFQDMVRYSLRRGYLDRVTQDVTVNARGQGSKHTSQESGRTRLYQKVHDVGTFTSMSPSHPGEPAHVQGETAYCRIHATAAVSCFDLYVSSHATGVVGFFTQYVSRYGSY
jgi:hypothetical protein